jgi:uncharacterized membrane protein YjgN (DUF898 family)
MIEKLNFGNTHFKLLGNIQQFLDIIIMLAVLCLIQLVDYLVIVKIKLLEFGILKVNKQFKHIKKQKKDIGFLV